MVVVLGYTRLRVGGRLGFGWCCGELCPGAGVPLRPDGVLLPLQQLVVNKEETTIACRRTCKGKSERGMSGSGLPKKREKAVLKHPCPFGDVFCASQAGTWFLAVPQSFRNCSKST